MTSQGTIVVLPFHGQGHIFPSSELCIRLASLGHRITFLLPSPSFASSSSLHHHPLIQISFLQQQEDHEGDEDHRQQPPPPPFPPNPKLTTEPLARLLSSHPHPILAAVVDVMMSWSIPTFREFSVPAFSFFTSGACSGAMELALWKLHPLDPKPGHVIKLPGLPDDVSLTLSDLPNQHPPPQGPPPTSARHHQHPLPPTPQGPQPNSARPPPPHHTSFRPRHPPPTSPPPGPGRPPPWVAETEGAAALLMNTCEDLERPFLEYLGKETEKPVWGVGPLLPANFWGAAGGGDESAAAAAVIRDGEMRSGPGRESSVGEEEVRQWLDRQERGSVVYVAFGTEVGPSKGELEELAVALEQSNRPFIWAIQDREEEEEVESFPLPGEGEANEKKGLFIRGWAPQLMILSHPSTGGFLTHCGWNSIMEALGRGVPLLAWPIRGDQHYNAKLVSGHLKAGLMVRSSGDGSTPVKSDDIVHGIERLMTDEETRSRAASIRAVIGGGFPSSSRASLDAFTLLLSQSSIQK